MPSEHMRFECTEALSVPFEPKSVISGGTQTSSSLICTTSAVWKNQCNSCMFIEQAGGKVH